jgi:hypothetical protein
VVITRLRDGRRKRQLPAARLVLWLNSRLDRVVIGTTGLQNA